MIPKIIHCCWIGDAPKDALSKKCRASWERFASDWEIREWNLESVAETGVAMPPFVREALAACKWAFVADWVRFLALAREGGVYLDTDVELVAALDELMAQGEFVGGEWRPDGTVGLGPAVLALEKDSPIAREMLTAYESAAFDGVTTVGELMTTRLARRPDLSLRVLSPEVFSPIDVRGVCRRTAATVGVHHYAMSWATPRRKIAKWLSWHGMRGVVEGLLSLRGRAEPTDVVHVLAGIEATSGVANIMWRLACAQREGGKTVRVCSLGEGTGETIQWRKSCLFGFLYFSWGMLLGLPRIVKGAERVWVHCSWTFPVWYGAWLARWYGKRLTVVPEGSFDPKRLHNRAGWKKRLVAPLDRWVLRAADEVLALCPNEVDWIRSFEPQTKVRLARVPLFLPETSAEFVPVEPGKLHVLFLGRAEDPLKGVRYLREAVARCGDAVELRIVSDHVGEALERDWAWCDVLCLPTLSENFGLVVAEALERGKRAITTDGASAWNRLEGGMVEEWSGEVVRQSREAEAESGGQSVNQSIYQSNNSLVYLRGFRDGTDETRVSLLTSAILSILFLTSSSSLHLSSTSSSSPSP